MEGLGILWTIIIGILVGAIAGLIMRGRGFGTIVNLIVGVAGSFLGGWIYSLLGLTVGGMFGTFLMSVIGAVVLLWIISFFKRSVD